MSLAFAKGYCDLNIPVDSDVQLVDLIKRALSCGFQTVAHNRIIDQNDLVPKNAPKKAKLDLEPLKIDLSEKDYPDLLLGGKKPVILSRLTIRFHNNDFIPLVGETVKNYDLIAILPESTLALQNLLKSGFKADILCFDPEDIKSVKWTRKLYNECISRNMLLEIPYSPCIRDATMRRRIVAQAQNYHAVGKSKGIFLSSAALNPLDIRGPHDVANLGCIFGLNEQQSKDAVKKIPIECVQNASGRRLGPNRALIQLKQDAMENLDDDSSSEEESESESSGESE